LGNNSFASTGLQIGQHGQGKQSCGFNGKAKSMTQVNEEFFNITHQLAKLSSAVQTDERGFLQPERLSYNLAVILSILSEVCDLDRSEIEEVIRGIPLFMDALERT
jgi:hypothetical protein